MDSEDILFDLNKSRLQFCEAIGIEGIVDLLFLFEIK